MGDEVWVKPPVYGNTKNILGREMGGNLGWFNNTGDRAFGPVVSVLPPDGQSWYEEVVERDWLGRVKSRRLMIAKATLDDIRNRFYDAWNGLVDMGMPPAGSEKLWEDNPWGYKLGFDECMELAVLMAGLYDWSGYDHINEIWAEIQNIDKGETDRTD